MTIHLQIAELQWSEVSMFQKVQFFKCVGDFPVSFALFRILQQSLQKVIT